VEVFTFEFTDSTDDAGGETREFRSRSDVVTRVDGIGSLSHSRESSASFLVVDLVLLGLVDGAISNGRTEELANLKRESVRNIHAEDTVLLGFLSGRREGFLERNSHLAGLFLLLVDGTNEGVVGGELFDLGATDFGFEVVAGLGDDGARSTDEVLELIAREELAVTIVSRSGDVPEGLVDFRFRVKTLEVEEDLVNTLRVGSEVKTSRSLSSGAEEQHDQSSEESSCDGNSSEKGSLEDAHLIFVFVFFKKKGKRVLLR
jgi:hypothetical protein